MSRLHNSTGGRCGGRPQAGRARAGVSVLPTRHAKRLVPAKRNGAVLAAVIVCLLAVMLFGTAIAQNLVLHQRQVRSGQERLQAFWLAESGLDRALAELRADPQYAGSEWRVEVDGPAGTRNGVVEIQVESHDRSPRHRQIHIVARWRDDPVHRSVHHKDLVIQLADPGDLP